MFKVGDMKFRKFSNAIGYCKGSSLTIEEKVGTNWCPLARVNEWKGGYYLIPHIINDLPEGYKHEQYLGAIV